MKTKHKTTTGFVPGFDVIDPALTEYAKTLKPSAKLIKLNEDMKKPYWQKFLKQLHEENENRK